MPIGVYNHKKGFKHSEETKEKISKANKIKTKKRWQNPEYRKKMSEAHKGKTCSEETKKRMSIAGTGRKLSEEWKKNISKSKQGCKHHMWKGGKTTNRGYILILKPEHPFCNKMGYVFEHRLVMEKYLGRYLNSIEIVHHEGTKYPIGSIENKQDNRIENLLLFNGTGKHIKHHAKLRRLANDKTKY